MRISSEELEYMQQKIAGGKKTKAVVVEKKRKGRVPHQVILEQLNKDNMLREDEQTYKEIGILQQTIYLKPLSVNEAWQGRRFKTDEYIAYEKAVIKAMQTKKLNVKPPFAVMIEYGFSNSASDIDNPTKLVLDILQKKYKFNDKDIYRLTLIKTMISKGKEYFRFRIQTI